MIPGVGSEVYIQSYKHNGSIHRTWSKALVIEADKEKIVAVTEKAWVIEADGRKWVTREPAICFFYTEKWYNIICMLRSSGIYYYCNLASPSIYDGEAIKNIDYDLDIKMYPDRSYQILDGKEYLEHAEFYHYDEKIMNIVEQEMEVLLAKMEIAEDPFNDACIKEYERKYKNIKENYY